MRPSIKTAAVLTFLLVGHTFADVMYYTFAGTIDTIVDEAGVAPHLIAGQKISYTFAIDLEADGYMAFYDIPDYYWDDTGSYDYFYTDLIGKGYLPQAEHSWGSVEEYHYGRYYAPSGTVGLQGDSEENWVSIWSNDWVPHVSLWLEKLGTLPLFSLSEYAYYPSGEMSSIESIDMELVSVVPAPTAVILGILGLGTAGIKLRKKKEV